MIFIIFFCNPRKLKISPLLYLLKCCRGDHILGEVCFGGVDFWERIIFFEWAEKWFYYNVGPRITISKSYMFRLRFLRSTTRNAVVFLNFSWVEVGCLVLGLWVLINPNGRSVIIFGFDKVLLRLVFSDICLLSLKAISTNQNRFQTFSWVIIRAKHRRRISTLL